MPVYTRTLDPLLLADPGMFPEFGLYYAGTSGDDWIYGTDLADTIDGFDGNDTLFGGGGNDTINGGAGNDYLSGGLGDDTLNGGSGDDTMSGGAGADQFIGGSGRDTVTYADASSAVIIHLDTAATSGNDGDGAAFGDNFTEIENITGSAYDDALYGDAGSNTLKGGAGNDTIDGGAGVDLISGDDGNDIIRGGADIDIINGGAGNDVIYGDGGDDILFGGAGRDTFRQAQGDGADIIGDFRKGEDQFTFSISPATAAFYRFRFFEGYDDPTVGSHAGPGAGVPGSNTLNLYWDIDDHKLYLISDKYHYTELVATFDGLVGDVHLNAFYGYGGSSITLT